MSETGTWQYMDSSMRRGDKKSRYYIEPCTPSPCITTKPADPNLVKQNAEIIAAHNQRRSFLIPSNKRHK